MTIFIKYDLDEPRFGNNPMSITPEWIRKLWDGIEWNNTQVWKKIILHFTTI